MKLMVKCLLILLIGSVNVVKICGQRLVANSFEQDGVVPDVISKAPDAFIEVTYPDYLTVELGNEFTPSQAQEQPEVNWDVEDHEYYFLAMIDPDAPSHSSPDISEVKHWIVGNIRGDDVSDGDTLYSYIPPAPPAGTGFHRYIFLVFKQPGIIQFDKPEQLDQSMKGRTKFSIADFAEEYGLGDPVAGNFFKAQHEEEDSCSRNE